MKKSHVRHVRESATSVLVPDIPAGSILVGDEE